LSNHFKTHEAFTVLLVPLGVVVVVQISVNWCWSLIITHDEGQVSRKSTARKE